MQLHVGFMISWQKEAYLLSMLRICLLTYKDVVGNFAIDWIVEHSGLAMLISFQNLSGLRSWSESMVVKMFFIMN